MGKSRNKIAREVRAQAVQICQAAAFTYFNDDAPYYSSIAVELGIDSFEALNLAVQAWCKVGYSVPWTREVDGEAAAMLATGWTPES